MNKRNFLFTAFIFAALSLGFASCDNDEPKDRVTFTLTVVSSDAEKGEVTGSGVYNEGTEVTITATPKPHYMFVEWSDGNTGNPRTIIVNKDVTYTAVFAGAKGSENGYEWVDLELSVKWATCNVGATQPEEYGNYYAWGEVEPKEVYDWSTYKWCNGSHKTMTKYCTNSVWGWVDNKTVLDPEDDAAAVNMGGAWRMPTYDELNELKTECTWTWTTLNDVNGCNVEGPNGNSIFLPAAGCRYDSDLESAGTYCDYWSSSLGSGDSSCGMGLNYFYLDYVACYYNDRYYGPSVRGVMD